MKPGIQSLVFGYVPLTHELERINALRAEINECERSLQEKRDELAAYRLEIAAPFEAELRKVRESA